MCLKSIVGLISELAPAGSDACQPPLDETAIQRQKRRYDMCRALAEKTWQKIPDTDCEPLPRGIKTLAAEENISVSAFSKDVKKHLARQLVQHKPTRK
jgi:hypothetical protein